MHQVIGKPFLTRAKPNRHWEKLVKNYERQREEKREKVENRELLCYCANVHRFHQSSQKHGIFTTHPEVLPPRSFYLRREGVLSERITYIIDTLTLPVWRGEERWVRCVCGALRSRAMTNRILVLFKMALNHGSRLAQENAETGNKKDTHQDVIACVHAWKDNDDMAGNRVLGLPLTSPVPHPCHIDQSETRLMTWQKELSVRMGVCVRPAGCSFLAFDKLFATWTVISRKVCLLLC